MIRRPLSELLNLLNLETIDEHLFRGLSPADRDKRIYGGQVLAQSLVAAQRTIPSGPSGASASDDTEAPRSVHSVHGYFMRAGDPAVPIIFEVEAIRNGRSFSTRRVVAIQHGKAIFSMDASFARAEPGLEHHFPMPPLTPADGTPEEVLLDRARAKMEAEGLGPQPQWQPTPFHMNYVDNIFNEYEQARHSVWIKLRETDAALTGTQAQILHTTLAMYVSDHTIMDNALLPHGGFSAWQNLQTASLDHAMWFHRPIDLNQWNLFVQDSPAAGAGRGMTRGLWYNEAGELLASAAQEVLMRQISKPDTP